jgi:hypothetical protein
MKTQIDLTDEGDELETAVLGDDGDMIMTFGDVDVRMTYAQFFGWIERINAQINALPDT